MESGALMPKISWADYWTQIATRCGFIRSDVDAVKKDRVLADCILLALEHHGYKKEIPSDPQ